MSSVMKSPARPDRRVGPPVVVASPLKQTGVTRRALLNVLETFFRRPVLHLLPLVILAALGAYSGLTAEAQYQSQATLNATSGTLLSDLTATGTGAFGYESPATNTARSINERLATDQFLDDVIDRARLRTAVETGALSRDDIRRSLNASASGNNLVTIAATTPRPEQSQLLASAVTEAFLAYVISNDLGDLQVRVDFYERQLSDYTARLDDATAAYETYMREHEIADEDSRPFVERLAIERLEQNLERASEAYLDAQANRDSALLQAESARAVAERQLRIIDPADRPSAPLSGRRDAAITFIMFSALGGVLSVAFVVARALLDRTVRVPDDVSARLDMDVLAVVPRGRRR